MTSTPPMYQDSSAGTPDSRTNGDAGSPRHSLERSRSNTALGPAAVMAGIVAGSIGGWSPVKRANGDEETERLLV
jgi:Ca2+-transporting ATPase